MLACGHGLLVFILPIIFICTNRAVHGFVQKTAHHFGSGKNKVTTNSEPTNLNLGYFHIVEGISEGIDRAVEECKFQFRWDQWNCPVTAASITPKTPQIRGHRANRETSFLQAMSAAGIMYHVTKMCNHPNDRVCGCGSDSYKNEYHTTDAHWKWSGCNHNVRFGEKVSKMVLGTNTNTRAIMSALKSHNERVGHKSVMKTLKTICKCQGVTGSCTMRTCWKQLSEFRDVGTLLKKKYKRSKVIKSLRAVMRNSNKVRQPRFTQVSKNDMVHFEHSPNYCHSDNSIGFIGTLGRECKRPQKGENRTAIKKWERNSCRRLCTNCGFKVRKTVAVETYDCECKFKWCCRVECKTCQRKVLRYHCK